MASSLPKADMVNAEFLVLTYGAMVAQLVKDLEDPIEVNKQLEKMGFRIGSRLVDDFCSKNPTVRCKSFTESMKIIATKALPTYLSMGDSRLEDWNDDGTSVLLVLPHNPLENWVELPEELEALQYSNLLAGAIRGALEMVNLRVNCTFESDALKGAAHTVIKVQLAEVIKVEAAEQYRDE